MGISITTKSILDIEDYIVEYLIPKIREFFGHKYYKTPTLMNINNDWSKTGHPPEFSFIKEYNQTDGSNYLDLGRNVDWRFGKKDLGAFDHHQLKIYLSLLESELRENNKSLGPYEVDSREHLLKSLESGNLNIEKLKNIMNFLNKKEFLNYITNPPTKVCEKIYNKLTEKDHDTSVKRDIEMAFESLKDQILTVMDLPIDPRTLLETEKISRTINPIKNSVYQQNQSKEYLDYLVNYIEDVCKTMEDGSYIDYFERRRYKTPLPDLMREINANFLTHREMYSKENPLSKILERPKFQSVIGQINLDNKKDLSESILFPLHFNCYEFSRMNKIEDDDLNLIDL
jgi:hypothetical protein